MNKLLFIAAALLLTIGCSNSDKNEPLTYNIVVESPEVFKFGQTTTVKVKITPETDIASVELYIDGKSYEKKFAVPYTFDVNLGNSKTGLRKLVTSIVFEDGTAQSSAARDINYVVAEGDEYGGGTVIKITDNGTHGTIAAKSNLQGGLAGKYSYGAYNGNYNSYSMDDGVANTNAFTGVMDSNYAAIACLNLELNGYDDWYLPAYNEFKDVDEFEDILIQPGYDNVFWTSTLRQNNTHAEIYTFGRTATTINDLDIQKLHYVRPFRRF